MRTGSDHITIPYVADDKMIEELVKKAFDKIEK